MADEIDDTVDISKGSTVYAFYCLKSFHNDLRLRNFILRKLDLLTLLFLLGTVQSVVANPTIQLNTTGQPPLNTTAQKGFMDEVATEAFARIGYRLQTTQLPAERGLKRANKGLIDGEMSRVKGLNKVYKNLIRVPEKIMDWEFVAFSRNPVSMAQGWNSLSGKSVGYINGWKILENNIPASAEVTKMATAEKLFTLLDRKRADFIIYELWGGHHILDKLSFNNVKLCQPPLAVKEMFIYLHKKNKNLVPKLSAVLSGMKKDGSYQKLVNQHLKPLLK